MQITDHIHALKIPFQVIEPTGRMIPRFVYVYLIFGKKIFLIDSGVASSEKIILEYLKKMGHRPEEISCLILTHSHPDHIGGASALQKICGCSVAAHAAERRWIEDVGLQERERPVPGFKSLVSGSVHVDQVLQEGDVLDPGDGLILHVFHTPGHSPGSISLWLPQELALFSADAIPIPGELPIFEDILASARSIERLKSLQKVRLLLAAWDDPRQESSALRAMEDGLDYLQKIQEAVQKVAEKWADRVRSDPMLLCRQTLIELGLPEAMANPLVAGSFAVGLEALDKEGSIETTMSPGRGSHVTDGKPHIIIRSR
ncbi:Hydroxyacylglutathione hydrolase [uncultured archaeon]|nr:Hydroxyacylglutathione hydrolase [uncultured archaeon]